MKEEINEYLSIYSIYDMWVSRLTLKDEQLINLEVFTSENGITDHYFIKKEMKKRGLEVINRNDWNTKRVGTFIGQVEE